MLAMTLRKVISKKYGDVCAQFFYFEERVAIKLFNSYQPVGKIIATSFCHPDVNGKHKWDVFKISRV